MSNEGKNVVIGIDGVPYTLIEELSDEGIMPNFAELREEGSFKKMESSIPAISSTSWGTIITGKNPGQHGIYGFTDIIQGTYTLSFSNFHSFKEPAFWQENDGEYVIINVPTTYPAQEMNGCHISGFVSPNMDKAVYPESLLEKLEEMDYKIDVDSEKGHKSERLLFKELEETLEARIKIYRYLWDEYDWDTFMLVFTGSDRLEHFLWDAYEDPNHKYHDKFLDFFRRIDEIIGEIDEKIGEKDSLVMLSDHGMERTKYNVNLNAYLKEEGYLKVSDDENKDKYNKIEKGTKAFALEHGRIYLNKKKDYPRGSVERGDKDKIISEIKEFFQNLEIEGEKVIKKVHEKEEIYRGGQIDNAPDLTLVPESGFNLRGKITDKFYEESPLTGMHNREAFIYGKGKNVSIPNKPTVEDFTSTIQKEVA